MVKAYCLICQSFKRFEKFVFTACGHGFCESCALQVRELSCPTCRERIDPEYGYRPIYGLTFADSASTSDKCELAVEDLDKIGPGSSKEGLDAASKKVQDLLQGSKLDDDVAMRLTNAISMLEDRLTPLFAQTHTHLSRIAELEAELRTQRQRASTSELQSKLSAEQQHRIQKLEKKSKSAERKYAGESSIREELQRRYDSQEERYNVAMAENRSLREEMTRQTIEGEKEKEHLRNQAKLYRTKAHALARQSGKTKHHRNSRHDSTKPSTSSNPNPNIPEDDDSLIVVEGPVLSPSEDGGVHVNANHRAQGEADDSVIVISVPTPLKAHNRTEGAHARGHHGHGHVLKKK